MTVFVKEWSRSRMRYAVAANVFAAKMPDIMAAPTP